MNQLVDNFFPSFAAQFPCSTKDSSDSPLPQDVRFPRPKDQCPLIALSAAKRAQNTTLQMWVSSTPLICSLKSKKKATVLHSNLSKNSAPDRSSCVSSVYRLRLKGLSTLQSPSTRTFWAVSKTMPSPYTEAVKVLDTSTISELLSTALCHIATSIPPACYPLKLRPLWPGHVTSSQQSWLAVILPTKAVGIRTNIKAPSIPYDKQQKQVAGEKKCLSHFLP